MQDANRALSGEWINATERLPGKGEQVVIYTPFKFFGDFHSCIGDRESLLNLTMLNKGKRVRVFTHWLPLPAKPDMVDMSLAD